MNDTDHLFALPEVEQHKLDDVKEEIMHPIARRARRSFGANVWKGIAISVAAGFLCGLALGHRA